MVTLTEVPDEHFEEYTGAQVEDDDDYTDTESEISNDSDFDADDESFAERFYALRDMIPPKTRGWIADTVSTASDRAWRALSFSGRAAWVVTSSALFLGVPFALAFYEDQHYSAMEQEYNMRQSGGDMLTAGTDEQQQQVAAPEGSEMAKPAL